MELNRLEARSTRRHACLRLRKGAGRAFDALKLDLVIFHAKGVVAKHPAVETTPVPRDKASLWVTDIAGLA